jgi:hypothetical protein
MVSTFHPLYSQTGITLGSDPYGLPGGFVEAVDWSDPYAASRADDREFFQENSVINYPNEHLYTRVTEFKYLTGQSHAKTSIVYEYPRAEGDPYYPVPMPENQELYKKYKQLADMTENTHFVGRLATYKYYNMDQVTAQALSIFMKLETRHRLERGPVSRISLSAAQSQLRDVSQSQVGARETSKLTGDRVA